MKSLKENKYWIWLSLIPNLGSKRKQKLLEILGSPKKIYLASRDELLKIKGIGEALVNEISNNKYKEILPEHIKYMEENNIKIINIEDKEYPKKLKEIYDPPISLYIKGNEKILNKKSISIVGCRDVSQYGIKASKYFSYQLSKQGINIISGLAKGVDGYAHYGNIIAIEESLTNKEISKQNISNSDVKNNTDFCGKTIAVLGNGLDIIYPKENLKLAEEIIKTGGVIISEYPLGTKPEKMNFPARNRIVSGLSEAVLVVEAKVKSGTLITVDFALEQGRDVYVVPGNINSIQSVGTNNLIKQGAKIATTYKDIEINSGF